MHKVLGKWLVIVAAACLTGCASMSAEECQLADWRTIGYEDGAKGRTADAIGRHRKACAKAGVAPDFDDYERGRSEGVRQFCAPGRGYEFGRNGGNYTGVCPIDMEDEFLLAYQDGRELYLLHKDVSDVESDINRVERELRKAQDKLSDVETGLIADGVETAERARLLEETKQLARQIGELENERDNLIYELGVRRERLAEYQDRTGIRG